MRRLRGLLAASLLLLPHGLRAHRLDECLQAVRLQPAVDRLALIIDLTPGVAVAPAIIDALDRNGDGTLSAAEEQAYAREVLHNLHLHLDHQRLELRPLQVAASLVPDLREGTGVLRITASADHPALNPGPHLLTLTNRHLPAISVHLVNALRPADPRLRIQRQTRSPDQRCYELAFHVEATDVPR